MKTKNLAIISMALAVGAILWSLTILSQSPEDTSQEVASTTTTNNGPVKITGAGMSFSLEQ